jgi:hypothetical protein
MGRFLFDPDPYAQLPERPTVERRGLYAGGGGSGGGEERPWGEEPEPEEPVEVPDYEPIYDPFGDALAAAQGYRWTTDPATASQWAQLAYQVKEHYPNITANSFIQRRVDQVAMDYMLETGAQATAYTLWQFPRFHQAMKTVNSGLWTLPTVFATAQGGEAAPTEGAPTEGAAPTTTPVLTYYYNSLYGPQEISPEWALLLTKVYAPLAWDAGVPPSTRAAGAPGVIYLGTQAGGYSTTAGFDETGRWGPRQPGEMLYEQNELGKWMPTSQVPERGGLPAPTHTYGPSFWVVDPHTGEGAWQSTPGPYFTVDPETGERVALTALSQPGTARQATGPEPMASGTFGPSFWVVDPHSGEGQWQSTPGPYYTIDPETGARVTQTPMREAWAAPIPIQGPAAPLPQGTTLRDWAYSHKPSGVNDLWAFQTTGVNQGQWVLDPYAVQAARWYIPGASDLAIPTFTPEELIAALQPTTTSPSGSGYRIAYDREEVKQYIEELWRGRLMEQVPDDTAYSMADAFIEEAISFYSQGGALDLEAWTVQKIHQTPRYSMMFHHKPPDMDDLQFLTKFQEVAGQMGVPERVRAPGITSAMSSGAGYQGYAEQAAQSAEVMGAFPNSFIQRLAKTAANSIATLG